MITPDYIIFNCLKLPRVHYFVDNLVGYTNLFRIKKEEKVFFCFPLLTFLLQISANLLKIDFWLDLLQTDSCTCNFLWRSTTRAFYMGEFRNITTSIGKYTKKTRSPFRYLRLLAQKKFFYEVNFFHSLTKLNSSLIQRLLKAKNWYKSVCGYCRKLVKEETFFANKLVLICAINSTKNR